jgi:NAD(P)-dependent dehydrogenase (short-subunit alcohol dehydrogenase family)
MDSVRNFSKEFMDKYDRLDVLINNAGAVFRKRETIVDGFERTLAVNYLGHFLLTYELLPLLKSSAPSRIINLSSGLHTRGTVDFSDLQSEKEYNGMTVYSNVKLMVTMFTYELARRLEGTGVTANVVLPGFVSTNLGSGSFIYKLGYLLVRPMQITPKKGAETSVYLASSDEVEGVTGKTFRELKETESSPESYDQKGQKQLWDRTNELLGLK